MTTLADRIAAAWVTACRATGDDPLRFGQWGWNTRARQVLFTALDRAQFGPNRAIARVMGAPNKIEGDNFSQNKSRWRFSLWWSPELVALCERAYRDGKPQDVSHIDLSETRGGARAGAGRPLTPPTSIPLPGDKDAPPEPPHGKEKHDNRRGKLVSLAPVPSLSRPIP